MDPTGLLKTLIVKEEALVAQIANLETTLSKLRESKKSLESLVQSIASEWDLENTAPTAPTAPTNKKAPRNVKTRTKVEPEPEVKTEPEPEPEPDTNTSVGDDEEGFIVSHKGVNYVVFPDNLDVIREDDKDEEVVGRWDSKNKVIIFN